MGRDATADEFISATIYLASKLSSHVNGYEPVIDGGWADTIWF